MIHIVIVNIDWNDSKWIVTVCDEWWCYCLILKSDVWMLKTHISYNLFHFVRCSMGNILILYPVIENWMPKTNGCWLFSVRFSSVHMAWILWIVILITSKNRQVCRLFYLSSVLCFIRVLYLLAFCFFFIKSIATKIQWTSERFLRKEIIRWKSIIIMNWKRTM